MNYEEKLRLAKEALESESYDKDTIEYIFPELKESEDEIMIKMAIKAVNSPEAQSCIKSWGVNPNDVIAWLEKQGESKNIDSDDLATLETWEYAIKENKEKWQLSDWFVEATLLLIQKVKRIENNENFNITGSRTMLNACINVLREVGHSHLSDWLEKQGEQKLADKVEPTPIFRIGDTLKRKGKDYTFIVDRILGGCYHCDHKNGAFFPIVEQDEWELVEQKPADKEYTFKAIPRLLEMIEPNDRAKAYCQKLIDSLTQEGYATDAKIVGECLKQMNGEKVAMATMDEQKPADKVEPKFKVGDWVIDSQGIIHQIEQVYEIASEHTFGYNVEGGYFNDESDNVRLWTIQDAKDGDVLTWDNSKCTALFKNIYDKESFNSHGFVGHCTGIFESRLAFHDIEGAHPATKEQRDTLFAKMHEAGYMWDSEGKQLLSLKAEPNNEHNPTKWNLSDFRTWQYIVSDVLTKHNGIGQYLDDGFCKQIAKYMQEEWGSKLHIQQKDTEWREEDERIRTCLIKDQEKALEDVKNDKYGHSEIISDLKEMYRERISWLKSLRPQNRWKPTDEQMEAFRRVYDWYNINFMESETLNSLYEDLKRLE